MSKYRWLGQVINIGKLGGIPPQNMIIGDNATAFSILTLFESKIAEGVTSSCLICHDSANNNVIALAYNIYQTQYDGDRYSTWFKWARDNAAISDDDVPPLHYYDSDNNWNRVGFFNPNNITTTTLLENSLAFYELDDAFYPYKSSVGTEFTKSDILGTSTNCIIVYNPGVYEVHDNTYGYVGATPVRISGTAITNWLPDDTTTYPSYGFTNWRGIGYGHYIYNPLLVTESKIIDSSDSDTSTPGGGGISGSYGWEGGNIWFSQPLALSAIDTGLLTLFSPTKTQVKDLADYLWNDSSFFTNIQKLWTEPLDTIISFGIIPCNLASITDQNASTIYVGNCNTGLTAFKLNKQYFHVDFGSVEIPLNSKNALDFEPFCRAQMYLPYIGFVPIKINEIMEGKVYLEYWIDCLSGDCIAQIGVEKYTNYQTNLKSILYEYHGNCLIKLPLCSRDFSSFYKNLITAPVGAISGAVGGGSVGGGVANGVASVVDTFLDGPDIQRSGAYSGSSSAFALRTPYIVITKACQQMPAHYSKYVGYPSFITYTLSELSGYTVIDGVIDNTVKATDTEKQEIERLLKEGVIL